ncbi:MAG: CRTAC1 family protein, partial [Bacteroidia bacterium]
INGALSSFEYDDGDSLVLNVYYVVVSNVQGDLKENTFDNEFYVSDYASPSNGQKKQCDEKHGRITLVGYAYRNRSQNYITLNNCSKKLNQQYGMEVANMYAGGNFFPYEYRDWGYLTEVRVIIPDGYEIESASLKHYSTINTNSKRTETQAITYDSSFGNTYIYNVGTYFENETLTISDDGFNGYFYVTLSPMCNTTIDRWHEVYYEFNYQQPAIMGGDTSGLITAVSDRIMYDPAELVISSPNPIQSTTSKEVSWNLTIENENNDADAPYMWLYIDEPNNFDLDSVVEVETSQALTPDNGFYKYGTLDQGESTDYIIYGSYSACDTATFQVYTGFSCDGFPASFESYDCAKEQYTLGVDPKEAQYQVRISNEELGDPCVPEVTLSLDISSVDIAHMYDMTITVTTPDTSHVKLLDGTTEFSSGGGATASVADPTYTTNTYTYTIGDYNASYPVDGIPGILSIPDNTYNIQFDLEAGLNYEPGDFVYIYIEGSDACGDTVPTTVLAYDLNTNFRKDNTAGLNIDIGNSWSASWGDYDNDGYDDLFVPINTIGESNILYHNDGDGTFTKITTGPVVEEDGSSVAGTWGDYDNDGYIDLFVANNINSENKLYHNEGDGTFTSIENSPIVDKGTYSHAAAWADYNRDGNLDLIVSDFHPTNFNFLFYGDGSGGFTEDKISDVGLDATSAVGVSWGDYDNDGDLDLFIANTNDENNNLYENQAGVLKRITTGDIVNDGGSSVGGTWGDYDNDGDLDLYVTNSRSYESNFFYENDGDGTFTKITTGTIVESISNSNGASWVDYNNDGYLDLMVANDQSEQNFLFRNNGDKSFSSVDNVITQDESDAYGVAWSDYDNDGDYDLIVANRGANVNDLFVNGKGSCTNHIVFTLDGCNSNSKGIGALIKVKANINGVDLWQSKHVATQNSAMGGQNSSNILFGLGDASTVDSAVVYWPSGIITYLSSTTVNAINTVTEQC